MKSFIISLILLVLITSAVFVNSLYSDKVYSELINALSDFPDKADEKVPETMMNAKKMFEKHSDYFRYVLPKSEFLDLSCDFSDVFAYYSTGDTPSYTASLQRTVNRLQLVKGGEEISFKEIFGS